MEAPITSASGAPPILIRPEPLEIACGLTLDTVPEAPRLATAGSGAPRAAIDAVIRRALLRPPCLVSFSGGRDSAAMLAAAAALARREGLALPVPVTYRFANAPGSHEDVWQEEVVRHVGLAEWDRLTLSDELDCIGPVARKVLLRHGVLWPFNAHFLVPLMERAAGGSLITGVGGDELLGPNQWWAARAVLSGRRRLKLRHLRTVGLALAPLSVKRAVLAGRQPTHWPWLQPRVEEALNRSRAAWDARTPLAASAAIGWWWQSRGRVVLSATLQQLAADAGIDLAQPFLDPAVMAAVARHFGRRGPTNRAAAMRALFGDVVSDRVCDRRSKAFFDEAFFSDHSRAFVNTWNGGGVDVSVVDAERLAATWRADAPDPRSYSLLQAVWLADVNRMVETWRSP